MAYNGQPQFKHGKPKVVLSFGARDSALFAQWLYHWIMKEKPTYKAAGKNTVYLDTFALMEEAGTQMTILPMINGPTGMTVQKVQGWSEGIMGGMLPESEMPGGIEQIQANASRGGVSALNDNWDEFYGTAVQACELMIFVITPEWIKSQACWHELAQFGDECAYRTSGQTKIRGLALTFENDQAFPPNTWSRFLELAKVTGRGPDALKNLVQVACNRKWAIAGGQNSKSQSGMRDVWELDAISQTKVSTRLP